MHLLLTAVLLTLLWAGTTHGYKNQSKGDGERQREFALWPDSGMK